MRTVVACPNWIGDAVMATPTLAALRRHFPEMHLALVARPYVVPVFDPAPYADEIIPWGKPGGLTTRELIGRLRRDGYARGVLLTNSFRSALVFFLGGVKQRIGYARQWRGALLTDRLKPAKDRGCYVPTPAITSYFDLIRPLGVKETSTKMVLYTRPADESAADAVYGESGLEPRETLVMAPGAAFGLAKCWPPARFAEIARRARRDLDLRTLLLCSAGERKTAETIAELSAGAAVLPGAQPGLGTVKAVVRRSRAMVTNDSGLRHFAAAYDVPAVTIFGPTHVNWTETWFAKETKLQHMVPCGPCQKRVCPEGHLQCMNEITADEVFAALRGLVEKYAYQARGAETVIGGA